MLKSLTIVGEAVRTMKETLSVSFSCRRCSGNHFVKDEKNPVCVSQLQSEFGDYFTMLWMESGMDGGHKKEYN